MGTPYLRALTHAAMSSRPVAASTIGGRPMTWRANTHCRSAVAAAALALKMGRSSTNVLLSATVVSAVAVGGCPGCPPRTLASVG